MDINGSPSQVAWQRSPDEVEVPGHLSNRGRANAQDKVSNPLWEVMADEWDPVHNPGGYVNLSVAENALLLPEIKTHVQHQAKTTSQTLRYGTDGFLGSHHLRTNMGDFLTRWLYPERPITAEQIVITSGVTNALETCAWTLLDAGEAVVVGRPYYMGFSVAFSTRADVKVLPVSFGKVDPFSLKAVEQYERVILEAKQKGIKVKSLLLCSPHNPLGRCYPRQTLIAFMRLCQRYRLHLISDEIYALSVFANNAAPDIDYTSVLAINKSGLIDPSRVHVLWGVSKDFGMNGLRIGCIISQDNPPFLKALNNISLFMGPSSVADDAAASVMSDAAFADWCVTTSRRQLAMSYAKAVGYLRAFNIECREDNNAGLFVWAKLGEDEKGSPTAPSNGYRQNANQERKLEGKAPEKLYPKSVGLMHHLLQNRVMVNSGDEYHAEEPGWYRIVFSHTDEYLLQGLERVVRTVLQRRTARAQIRDNQPDQGLRLLNWVEEMNKKSDCLNFMHTAL